MKKKIAFETYGLRIGIESNDETLLAEIIDHLEVLLPVPKKLCPYKNIDHSLTIIVRDLKPAETGDSENKAYGMFLNEEELGESFYKKGALNFFYSRLRLTVAEFARGFVFLHAGAVAWKGGGIIFPANSHGGKTTLVKELIQNGAVYYSDEFAVLDENGLLYPFPKLLSVRGIIDEFVQLDLPAESFGGKLGKKPVPVKMVILTEFAEHSVWKPEYLGAGRGILEMIPHTIPIRSKPEFALQVLNRTLNHAIIAKSKRGEAKSFVKYLLPYLDAGPGNQK